MAKKYLSLEEAADILGITPQALIRHREHGDLRGFADRGTWKFREQDVTEFGRTMQADSSPDVPMYGAKKPRPADPILPPGKPIPQPSDLSDSSVSDSDVRLMFDEKLNLSNDGFPAELAESSSDVRLVDDGSSVSIGVGSDSDVRLIGGDTDSDIRLPQADSDSDVKIVETDSDSDVELIGQSDSDSDVTLLGEKTDSDMPILMTDSDSDVQLLMESDSDVRLPSDSDSDVQLLGDSDSDVRLTEPDPDSDVLLDGTDNDLEIVVRGLDRPGSESDVMLVPPEGSGATLTLGDESTDSALSDEVSSVIMQSDQSELVFDDDVDMSEDSSSIILGGDDIFADNVLAESSGILQTSPVDSGISLESIDSGVSLESMDSGISLEPADSGISLEVDSELDLAGLDSGISLDPTDSDVVLATESGMSFESDDSGISLESDDSGISLDLPGSGITLGDDDDDSGISLMDSDSGIALAGPKDLNRTQPMMSRGGAATDNDIDTTQFEIPGSDDGLDSEFELAGLDDDDVGSDTSVLLFDDDDGESGTSPLADLSDEVGADSEVYEGDEFAEEDGEFYEDDDEFAEDDDDFDVFEAADEDFEEDFDEGASGVTAPRPGGAAAAGGFARNVEYEWGMGPIAGVMISSALMGICSIVIFDLVRTMWAYDDPTPVTGMLLDTIGGLF